MSKNEWVDLWTIYGDTVDIQISKEMAICGGGCIRSGLRRI